MDRQDVPHDPVQNGGVLDRGVLNLEQLKATLFELLEQDLELANPSFSQIFEGTFGKDELGQKAFEVVVLKLLKMIETHVRALDAETTDSPTLREDGPKCSWLQRWKKKNLVDCYVLQFMMLWVRLATFTSLSNSFVP